MTTDHWQSVLNDERTESKPDWGTVHRSICQLDGKTSTLVTLVDDRGGVLFVGGSKTGLVVALSRSDENLLARMGESLETMSVVVGGQTGDYAKRNVLSLEAVCGIVRAYYDGADLDQLTDWEAGLTI
jgi:hypothetical protein